MYRSLFLLLLCCIEENFNLTPPRPSRHPIVDSLKKELSEAKKSSSGVSVSIKSPRKTASDDESTDKSSDTSKTSEKSASTDNKAFLTGSSKSRRHKSRRRGAGGSQIKARSFSLPSPAVSAREVQNALLKRDVDELCRICAALRDDNDSLRATLARSGASEETTQRKLAQITQLINEIQVYLCLFVVVYNDRFDLKLMIDVAVC